MSILFHTIILFAIVIISIPFLVQAINTYVFLIASITNSKQDSMCNGKKKIYSNVTVTR